MVTDIKELCAIMSRVAQVDEEDILSHRRNFPLPVCRSIIYDYCRNNLNFSTNYIGKLMDHDHATVLSSLKRLKGWLDIHDKFICDLYQRFQNEIQNSE